LQRKRRNFERDPENENRGAGVYSASLKKHYILANYEWKEGILIEILHEQNVADFLEPDILKSCENWKGRRGSVLKRKLPKMLS
jgi:nucleolar GTP-binding protein